ncbi:hypothetical protein RYO59_001225 [Thermosynechococcaceae cyanobacterium Okahandja]
MNGWQRLVQHTVVFFLCLTLFSLTGGMAWAKNVGGLAEVAAPVAIEDLKGWFDRYEPRLQILSPQPDQTLETTTVAVELNVTGLNIFQDPRTGLGPHVEVVLDDRPSRSVFDLKAPIEFTDLQPGTHLVRAFVVYPWGESIKSPLAYAERMFHLYTSTADPAAATTPLLTYNQPQGVYGAEPVLLDFYLSHLPDRPTWQVRCTINGQSFTVNRWQAYYLTGLQSGENWVRLDLLDSNGQPLADTTITRLVTYHPGGNDPLSRLLRGELAAKNLQSSLSPSLPEQLPPPPEPEPSPTPEPAAAEVEASPPPEPVVVSPEPSAPEPVISPAPEPTPVPPQPFWQRFGLGKPAKKESGSVLVAPRPATPEPEAAATDDLAEPSPEPNSES